MHHTWKDESWGIPPNRTTYGEAYVTIGGRDYTVIGQQVGDTCELWLASRQGTQDAISKGQTADMPVTIGPLTGRDWLSLDTSVAIEAMREFVQGIGLGGEWAVDDREAA